MIPWTWKVFHHWVLYALDAKSGSPPLERYDPLDPVIALVYEAQRPKKKDMARLEPFVKPNIRFIGKSPLQNTELFPNGIIPLGDRDKWLFLVFPTTVPGTNTKVANHFTFVLDKNDTKKPCHFHSTFYTQPSLGITTPHFWMEVHTKDYFPDELTLPDAGTTDAILHQPVHEPYKAFLLDWMRLPWSQGVKKKNETHGGAQENPQRPIVSQRFSTLWLERAYRCMVAFGMRDLYGGGIRWTVRFVRKGRRPTNRMEMAYVFTTPTEDERVFQETLAQEVLRTEPF